jgi:hypothetical protein
MSQKEKWHVVNAWPGIVNYAHYNADQAAQQPQKRKDTLRLSKGFSKGGSGESKLKPG